MSFEFDDGIIRSIVVYEHDIEFDEKFFDKSNTRCIVSYDFNKELDKIFIDKLKQKKTISLVFNNYTSIIMMEHFLNKFPGCDTMEHGWRGSRFNKCIDLLAETNLKLIEFGAKFNKPVSNLPETLEMLIFDKEFNQSLDNLPTNLIFLSLFNSTRFNYNLDYLPEGLETLILPEYYYTNPIDNLPIGTDVLNLSQYEDNKKYLVFEY